MSKTPITAYPVDYDTERTDLEFFGYHEAMEKENRGLRFTVYALATAIVLSVAGMAFMAHRIGQRQVEVVRINDVGQAEAVAYKGSDYKPQAPEIRYFLTQWATDYYSRERQTITMQFPRSLFFLSQPLSDAVTQRQRQSREITKFISGQGEEVSAQVTTVHITNLQTQPYSAEVFLTRIYSSSPMVETRSEKWIVSVQFLVNPEAVKNELVPYNPLGLSIISMHEDQSFQ